MLNPGEVSDAPSPVMTLRVGDLWLAVPVEQVARIAITTHLWPVPTARADHLGLMDNNGEIVPVLRLAPEAPTAKPLGAEQLVAVLQVRGEAIGLAIDGAGRVYDGFRMSPNPAAPPEALRTTGAKAAHGADQDFWIIDPDALWRAAQSDTLSHS